MIQQNISTETFYLDLPYLDRFIDITDCSYFVDFPPDWLIVVTDIVGSTKAIEAGRYKEVNLLGASSIVAVLNAVGDTEIPFVFGGDGATLLIPPALRNATEPALLGTQQLARDRFNLELRVGYVPVADVVAANYSVQVAKLRVNDRYNQGIFYGGGLTYATDLVKHPELGKRYQLNNPNVLPQADFSGLECRWQDIPSQAGEMLSLLVMANDRDRKRSPQIYKEVIQYLYQLYGGEEKLNPLVTENLKLALSSRELLPETKVQAPAKDGWQKMLYLSKIQASNWKLALLMKLNLQPPNGTWENIKAEVLAASDYRKFDDMLRAIVASSSEQREQLTEFLDRQYRQGKLVYGLHVSDRAMMTCLVFEKRGREVHFIDGADGGYALAAKQMKAQMKELVG